MKVPGAVALEAAEAAALEAVVLEAAEVAAVALGAAVWELFP